VHPLIEISFSSSIIPLIIVPFHPDENKLNFNLSNEPEPN
jgi:hypothetical protein